MINRNTFVVKLRLICIWNNYVNRMNTTLLTLELNKNCKTKLLVNIICSEYFNNATPIHLK